MLKTMAAENRRAWLGLLAILTLSGTAQAQWEPEVKLSSGEGNGSLNENMGRCIIASGDAVHAVWCEHKDKDHAIYYRRSNDKGATWDAAVRLSEKPGADSWPLLALSGNTLHLVFLRNGNSPEAASYYKRSTDGGKTWGPDVLLGKTKFWPGVASSGSMVYVALNTLAAEGNTEVYVRRSLDSGETWKPQEQISNAPGRSEDPAIAACGKHVYLVWNDNRDSFTAKGKGMAVYYRHSEDQGATWGPETAQTHAPEFTYMPTIFPTEKEADILYTDHGSGPFAIYHMHSADAGATWDAKKEKLPQSDAPKAYPSIVRDGANVHVVWGEAGKLMYLHSGDGGAHWDPAETLAKENVLPFAFIAVAGDVVHVQWVEKRNGQATVFSKRNLTGNAAVKLNAAAK
ncbi:MAG: exo-alpha-sialidase [Planctomycetes bacterium]|nr:exo-alpha-sialidase [Planctomycetota bacterium]